MTNNAETQILSRRISKVIEFGNSIGLTLREELLDMELGPQDQIQITLERGGSGEKKIIIKRVE